MAVGRKISGLSFLSVSHENDHRSRRRCYVREMENERLIPIEKAINDARNATMKASVSPPECDQKIARCFSIMADMLAEIDDTMTRLTEIEKRPAED